MTDLDQMLRAAGDRLRADAPTADETEAALISLGDVELEPLPSSRTRFWIAAPTIAAVAAAIIAIVVVTRPNEETGPPATDPVVTVATPVTAPSDPTTAVTPSPSTVPPTTAPSTAPSEPPASRWTSAPPADRPSLAGDPCCGANASGPVSPEFTPGGSPLADGIYAADVSGWSPDDPTRLSVTLRRYIPCVDAGLECNPSSEDGSYGPDEVGKSSESRDLEITLDESVTIDLLGADVENTSADQIAGVRRITDGGGLASLMSELAESYDELIAAPLQAGTPHDEIVSQLQRNPRGGFTSAKEDNTGDLYFTSTRSPEAPGVLFQGVTAGQPNHDPLPRSGTSKIDLGALEVRDGVTTLYFYTGFVS